jgi:hypothetical protein
MRIVRNEPLIKRNGKIGQWSSIAGLITLAGGMYVSIKQPERFGLTVAALLVGFTLVQISMHYGSRYGRSPRPDEKLDAGLKGLPGDFVIYHYTTPVPHLLVGPAGAWVLLPYPQRGLIAFANNRWRLSGGGFLQSYLRIFGQEGIGNPGRAAAEGIANVEKFLHQRLGSENTPTPQAAIVLTDDQATLEAEGSPYPALRLRNLKEFMRQRARERTLTSAALSGLTAAIEAA